MSARKTESSAAALSDMQRQAKRLLAALAEPHASAKPTDIPRPALLAVSVTRKGVTLVSGHFPISAGAHLVSEDLAQWSEAGQRRTLEITATGRAKLRRDAAPASEKYLAQHRELGEVVLESHDKVTRNEAESPLAWLARRKGRDGHPLIAPAAFAAGERFRRDFTLAGLQPRITSDWSSPVTGASPGHPGMNITDLMIAARQRLNAALDALEPEFAALITDVCGFLKGLETAEAERSWPARSAKVVLALALGRLAAHYGLTSEAQGPARSRALVHWGSDDYRPKISADQ